VCVVCVCVCVVCVVCVCVCPAFTHLVPTTFIAFDMCSVVLGCMT